MLLLEPQPGIVDHHRKAVVETISNVVPRLAVPESHDQHVDHVTDVGSGRP